MVRGTPVKVKCKTCKTVHAYHRPKEDVVASKKKGAVATTARAGKTPAKAKTSAGAKNAAAQDIAASARPWQARVGGQPASAFTVYAPKGRYSQDQLLRHGTFGDGYVVEVIDAGKIEVMFRMGSKILVQGYSAARR
jgi:hypothetical protein